MPMNVSTEPTGWTMTQSYFEHVNRVMQMCTLSATSHDARGLFDWLVQLMNLVRLDVDANLWNALSGKINKIEVRLLDPKIVGFGVLSNNRRLRVENECFRELIGLQSEVYFMMQPMIKMMRRLATKEDVYKQLGVKFSSGGSQEGS